MRIVVVGSANTDMVVKTSHFPAPGETIIGGKFLMNPGGKGANQAVAAARLGGEVVFVARVGDDLFGQQARDGFVREGINTDHVTAAAGVASGVALITVDEEGENNIVVAPGANALLGTAQLDAAEDALADADYVLTQLETPLGTIIDLANRCQRLGKRLILNPAPADELPTDLYPKLYAITPNESEAEILTGIAVADEEDAARACQKLLSFGVRLAVITLGARGAYWATNGDEGLEPGERVRAIDTTAAGDTFNGALAVALAEGMEVADAVAFANRAAALSVTRMGAQASVPHRHDISPT